MDGDPKAALHLLSLALWVEHRDEFRLDDLRAHFPEYRGAAGTRRWALDERALRGLGLRLRRTPHGLAPVRRPLRVHPVRLGDGELTALDHVAALASEIAPGPLGNHLSVALRRVALAGVPFEGAIAIATAIPPRRHGHEADALSILKGIWAMRRRVEIVYPGPGTPREVRHVVEPHAVSFPSSLLVGRSDRTGITAFYLPLIRSLRYLDRRRDLELGTHTIPERFAHLKGGVLHDPRDILDAAFPVSTAGRRGARSRGLLQRTLAVGYLLLDRLFHAPDGIPWDAALRGSGARDRAELERAIDALEKVTIPRLHDPFGLVAIRTGPERIGVYLAPRRSYRVALRPHEAGVLVAACRASGAPERAAASLAEKLLGAVPPARRPEAEATAEAFRLAALAEA